jgi:hypothetical protein
LMAMAPDMAADMTLARSVPVRRALRPG